MARANLATFGMSDRAEVMTTDFLEVVLPDVSGPTLFVGNPPYVRHHLLNAEMKDWLATEAGRLGYSVSKLAGLHVYFFLQAARLGRPQDFGAYVTAAEWLDVNYGQLVRDLFLGALGGRSIAVVEPTATPFADAATTAAVTTFKLTAPPRTARLSRVATLEDLDDLKGGRSILRERLAAERRWSHLTRRSTAMPEGFVELGELCRVHRGQVTGGNKIWIAGPHSSGLPEGVLVPAITKARELIRTASGVLDSAAYLRRVIDLPVDLDELDAADRVSVERFLSKARSMGADKSYTARHRRAWWAVGLRDAAPILATYMARRPPAFVLNRVEARHINIAHGLYPREAMTADELRTLSDYLRSSATRQGGRTYAGGLTKFEPREMERFPVPNPEFIRAGALG
jgi:hypothetical protein